ncbi:Glycerol-3-phosphate cytidylyltransferase [Chlamydia abortus]|uniref:Glycerol-3-phosphate cytidylyltransferase n=1 Tax=Paenibacillus residui TaxID=629724 RepID=A0ABW3DE22_9BACL|nr:Glycerol-3-phosphate cytidylyltransferase [Chlamydia abortus]
MIRVITYGTFDLFHYGHINLLRRAKELGDHLTVGLSTDHFNKVKGKLSHFNYEERKQLLESIKYVDRIIPENSWEQKIEDIKKYQIDLFVMGSDWSGKFDILEKYCKVRYLPRTNDISSSLLKEIFNKA